MTTIKNLGSIALTLSALGLLPNLAQAQCTPAAPAADPGADTLACVSSAAANVYGPSGTNGIVFTSSGDLTVNLTGSAATNLGSGGVSLSAGSVSDNLTFNRSGGAISGSGNTASSVVQMQTQNGDIRIDTNGSIGGNAANVQYGVNAQALGNGDIHISTSSLTGTSTISTGTTLTNPGIAAIYAQSNGGNIRIESGGTSIGNDGKLQATGREYGVLAETTGTGDLYFRGGASASSAAGIAALDLTTETGLLTVDLVGTGLTSNARTTDAVGIRITTNGGNAVVNRLGAGGVTAGGPASGAANVNTTAVEINMNGGTTTINNVNTSGSFGQSSANVRGDGLLRAIGNGTLIFNNSGSAIYGRMDLSAFDGDFRLDNTAAGTGWFTYGENVLAGGDNAVINAAGSMMVMGSSNRGLVQASELIATRNSLRFGQGQSSFDNHGTLLLGQLGTKAQLVLNATTVSFEGLNAFTNAGDIIFGQYLNPATPVETDGFYDDILEMRGTHFTGLPGSRLAMDVLFNGYGQSDCSRVTTLAHEQVLSRAQVATGQGFLRGADCMDLREGRVSGQTAILLNEAFPGDRGAYNPDGTVLVDVRGGTVDSPDAFVLSTDTVGYNAELGGVIDKGVFLYALGYEAAANGEGGQFKLYGVEAPVTQQLPLLAHAASDLWRSTTVVWTDRRRAQRDGEAQENELARGVWLRGGASSADRSVNNSVAVGDGALHFDNGYTQNNSSLTFGIDVGRLTMGSGEWTVGAMFGYARARIGYDAGVNNANFEGAHLGVYGSFTSGRFFHDLVVNTTMLNLDNDLPSLNLQPAGTVLSTDVRTNGARLDTGWRFEPMERVRVEPVLSLEWLKTGFEQLRIPADDPTRLGANIDYEDSRSLRTGLGLRLGMKDLVPSLLPVDVSLSLKSMRESDGEAAVTVVNVGDVNPRLDNTFDGTFNEVNGTLTLGNRAGTMSGYVNIQSVFGDDYDSFGGSAGFRLQW
jgi:hypothetical protein